MRRFPCSWNDTLTALGFKRKKRQTGPKRSRRLEQLEAKIVLTADPLRPLAIAAEYVVVGGSGSPFFDVEETEAGGAILRLREDAQAPVDEKLTLQVEKRLGALTLERVEVIVDLVEQEFLDSFYAQRLEQSASVTESIDLVTVPFGPLDADQSQMVTEASELDSRVVIVRQGVSERPVFEQLLVEANEAEHLNDDGAERLYGELATSTAPHEVDRTNLDRASLGDAALLLSERLGEDLRSDNPTLATNARELRDRFVEETHSYYTLWTGLGVNHVVEKTTRGLGEYQFVLYESGDYQLAEGLAISIGQEASIEFLHSNPSGAGLAPLGAALVTDLPASQDTVLASNDSSGSWGETSRFGFADSFGGIDYETLFGFDVSALVGQHVQQADITLFADRIFGGPTTVATGSILPWGGTPLWADRDALSFGPQIDAWAPVASTHHTIAATELIQRASLFGDLNLDGVLNAADLDALHQAIVNPADYAASYELRSSYGHETVFSGDADWNNLVDHSDIDAVFARHGQLIGDFNLDGVSSVADYDVMLANWDEPNRTYTQGDSNFDGSVGLIDYIIWRDSVGQTAPLPADPIATLRLHGDVPDTAAEAAYATSESANPLARPKLSATHAPDLVAKRFDLDGGDLRVTYNVVNEAFASGTVEVWRSSDGVTLDAVLMSRPLSAGDLSVGHHNVSFAADFDSLLDVEEDYQLVVKVMGASSSGEAEHSSDNNTAVFLGGAFTEVDGDLHVHGGEGADVVEIGLREATVSFEDGSESHVFLGTEISFNDHTLVDYRGQTAPVGGATPHFEVRDGGDSLYLENNAWRVFTLPTTITPDTVVEFDYESTAEGEVHGFGFHVDINGTNDDYRLFRLHGSDAASNGTDVTPDYQLGSGLRHYRIPIGQLTTNQGGSNLGSFQHLFFFADNDATGTGNATFSNVRIYEDTAANVINEIFVRTQGGDDAVSVIDNDAVRLVAAGGSGNDLLQGAAQSDLLLGGQGDDILTGAGGDDELHGDSGEDSLFGDVGGDILVGGLGADLLVGGEGDDTLHGSLVVGVGQAAVLDDGSDTLVGGDGFNTLHVDYQETAVVDRYGNNSPYKQAGGDFFEVGPGDTVTTDSGSQAPDPSLAASTWNQEKLWQGNYGFGDGWNLLDIDRLEFTGSASAPTSLKWVRSDGHTVTLAETTPGTWTPVSGDPTASVITYDATSSRLQKTDKFGGVAEYAVAATGMALVVRSVDRLGVGREYAYSDHDGDGNATEIDSVTMVRPGQLGETTTYNYSAVNGHQRVTSIVDPFGRDALLHYAGVESRLEKVELPEISGRDSGLKPRVGQGHAPFYQSTGRPGYDFDYDANGYISTIWQPDFNDDDPIEVGAPIDQVKHHFTWQSNGELWVEDNDPNPIRYQGAPQDVYTEWMYKTNAWHDHLPAFLLTDGLESLTTGQTQTGYTVDEAGRTTLLTYTHDGAIVQRTAPTGAEEVIARNSAGQIDTLTLHAPGDGRVVDQVAYTYDARFNQETVTHYDSTHEVWTYDPVYSQVESHTDELGRRLLFEVDPNTGNTTEMRVVVGSDDRNAPEADDIVTAFAYEADGLLAEVIEYRNDIDGAQQTSLVTQYEYTSVDALTGPGHTGRWLQSTTIGGDDPATTGVNLINSSVSLVVQRDDYGNPTEVSDHEGRPTFYEYDELDRLVFEAADDPGYGQQTPAMEWGLSFGGRVESEGSGGRFVPVFSPGPDLPFATSQAPASQANAPTSSLPESPYQVNTLSYDACSCPHTWIYDAWSMMVAHQVEHNPDGTVGSETRPDGRKDETSYNADGAFRRSTASSAASSPAVAPLQTSQLASAVSTGPERIERFFHRNARGELVLERDGEGVVTQRAYDRRGRQVATVVGGAYRMDNVYDDAGQVVAEIDGEGRQTTFVYDDAGRTTEVHQPGITTPSRYQYDTHGNQRVSTDANGNASHTTYDERGRVTTETDADGGVTGFTYYDDDQIKTITDPNLNTTTFVYDGAGRLYSETNELGHARFTRYDAFNRVQETVDREGRTIRYRYSGNFLLYVDWYDADSPPETGSPVRRIEYQYERLQDPTFPNLLTGKLFRVVDTGYELATSLDDNNHQFFYDDFGRLDYRTVQIGESPRTTIDVAYDAAERVTTKDVSMQQGHFYAFDHTRTFGYDGAGRVSSITQTGSSTGFQDKHVEFAYNRANQLTNIDRYAAATVAAGSAVASTTREYDPTGRLSRMEHRRGAPGAGGDLLAGYGYSYDDGNRLTAIDFLPDGVNSPFDYTPEDVTYAYDARNQIDTADYSGTAGIEEDYAFDANGNRVGAQVIDGAFEDYEATAGVNNRLHDDGTHTYTYDNEGNRVTRTLKTGVSDRFLTEYAWDHLNRLRSVTFKDNAGVVTEQVTYQYDYLNQLVSRTHDTDGDLGSTAEGRTTYVHDDGQVILQFDKTGAGSITPQDLSHRYLWGPAVDQLLADEQIDWNNGLADGEVLWVLPDHLSSSRDVVDSGGALRVHTEFDTFGRIAGQTHFNASGLQVTPGALGYFTIDFLYTGKLFDFDTGLQNNLNRWYDSATGRWLSEDPIGFAAGDANLSRYVGNAAVTHADPDGLREASVVLVPQVPANLNPNTQPCIVCPRNPNSGLHSVQTPVVNALTRLLNNAVQDQGNPQRDRIRVRVDPTRPGQTTNPGQFPGLGCRTVKTSQGEVTVLRIVIQETPTLNWPASTVDDTRIQVNSGLIAKQYTAKQRTPINIARLIAHEIVYHGVCGNGGRKHPNKNTLDASPPVGDRFTPATATDFLRNMNLERR